MAASNLNGENYEIAENFNPASESLIASALWGGKVRVQIDKKTVNAIEANSTIKVGKLPKGACFLAALIRHEALGTGVTLQLGDGDSADRYLAAASAATAGVLRADALGGLGYQVSADTDIVIKTGSATTASANKKINTVILYSLE
jgi:hypothetical protein